MPPIMGQTSIIQSDDVAVYTTWSADVGSIEGRVSDPRLWCTPASVTLVLYKFDDDLMSTRWVSVVNRLNASCFIQQSRPVCHAFTV